MVNSLKIKPPRVSSTCRATKTGGGAYKISGGANGGYLGIEVATWMGMLSIGIDFIPGVGSVKGIIELITGKDIITGQPISRLLIGVAVIASFVGLGFAAKGLGKAMRKMIRANRSSNKIGQVGEAAVNVIKGLLKGPLPQRARSFTINGRNRIADGVNREVNFTEMWEVKNVKNLNGSHKEQIGDYLDFIAEVKKNEGRDINFELFIRGPGPERTHITAPMAKWLGEHGVTIKFIGEFI